MLSIIACFFSCGKKKFLASNTSSFNFIEFDNNHYNPLVHLMIVMKQSKCPPPPDAVIASEIYLYLPPVNEKNIEIELYLRGPQGHLFKIIVIIQCILLLVKIFQPALHLILPSLL